MEIVNIIMKQRGGLMKKTVMIVEDEARIREFVGLYLRKEGYDVVEACDGEDAVEKFKTHDIDLIVLDVMMPKLNGFEVCQMIREKSSLPIIILTAVEEESEHVRGYELGADDYVTKPFKVKILIAKINRIFEKTSPLENKNVFEYEGFKADFDGRSASIDGRDIKLASFHSRDVRDCHGRPDGFSKLLSGGHVRRRQDIQDAKEF